MEQGKSDAALVLAARAGDTIAFVTLLERHRMLLLALCRRTLGDRDAAEDASQEAILQALLNLDRLRQPERFGPWLAGIGLNVCRRMRRERSRGEWSWEAVQGGRRLAEPVAWAGDPAALAETADVQERVRGAVAGLPPGQRAAVALFYLGGLSHAQTAARLGIEVGAVKTRLHKARRALRQHLAASWEEDAMGERLNRRTLAKTAGALAGLAAAGQLTPATAATRQRAAGEEEIMAGELEGTRLIEMRVVNVLRPSAEADKPHHLVVLLEEIGGPRRLPIWIGPFEGEALALQLERVETPRPMTYALVASALQAAGGRVREVQITRLTGDTFYATVHVDGPDGTKAIDARPSDALNLALLTDSPIRVGTAILETGAGSVAPEDAARLEGAEGAAAIAAGITEEWAKYRPRAASAEG